MVPITQPPAEWDRIDERRHGVLFVHGLGQQPQSDTLLLFGGPLVEWLKQWYATKGQEPVVENVKLGFSTIDLGNPIHAYARVMLPAVMDRRPPTTWILSEAWWASSVVRPNFWTMVWRCLVYIWRIVPMLAWHQTWWRIRRLKNYPGGKPRSSDPPVWARVVDIVNTLFAGLVYAAFGLFATVFLLLPLAALSRVPIPGLQDFVLAKLLQPLVQMQIGEFEAFMTQDLQAINMQRRIAEAIQWLIEKEHCADVTVVAHSGGAILAFGALSDAALRKSDGPLGAVVEGKPHIRRVRKLVTLGEGLNRSWQLFPQLERLRNPLAVGTHWVDFWTAYDPVPGGWLTPPRQTSAGGPDYVEIFTPDERVRTTQHLEKRVDPDPDSKPSPNCEGQFWPVSEQITNRMTPLIDHGLYWTNSEQYTVRLAAEIDQEYYQDSPFWYGTAPLAEDTPRTEAMTLVVRDRRERVAWLVLWRGILFLSGLGTVWARWPWVQPGSQLYNAIVAFLTSFALLQPVTQPVASTFQWLVDKLNEMHAPDGVLAFLHQLTFAPGVAVGCLLLLVPWWITYAAVSFGWEVHDANARKLATERIAHNVYPSHVCRLRWAQVVTATLVALPLAFVAFPVRSDILGQPPLDSRWWGYTRDVVAASATALGPAGRQLYAISEVTLDMVFPLAYASALAIAIALLARDLAGRPTRWSWLGLVAVLAGLFDWTENVALASIMWRYPDLLDLAPAASLITQTKWLLVGASIILLLLLAALRKAQADRSPP